MGVVYNDPYIKTPVEQAARQRLLGKIADYELSTVATGPPSPSGLPQFSS